MSGAATQLFYSLVEGCTRMARDKFRANVKRRAPLLAGRPSTPPVACIQQHVQPEPARSHRSVAVTAPDQRRHKDLGSTFVVCNTCSPLAWCCHDPVELLVLYKER